MLKFVPKSCFFAKIPFQNQFFFARNSRNNFVLGLPCDDLMRHKLHNMVNSFARSEVPAALSWRKNHFRSRFLSKSIQISSIVIKNVDFFQVKLINLTKFFIFIFLIFRLRRILRPPRRSWDFRRHRVPPFLSVPHGVQQRSLQNSFASFDLGGHHEQPRFQRIRPPEYQLHSQRHARSLRQRSSWRKTEKRKLSVNTLRDALCWSNFGWNSCVSFKFRSKLKYFSLGLRYRARTGASSGSREFYIGRTERGQHQVRIF